MDRSRIPAFLSLLLLAAAPALAAPALPAPAPAAPALAPPARAAPAAAPEPLTTPESVAMAKAIDAELVACGTRLSLAAWTAPTRGVGCGRTVVVRHFRAIADHSGGRLKVVVDSFETSGPRTGNV